jgi:hypothetical protein
MNYEKKVMINAYEILTKTDFKWTDEFGDEMKVKFINLLLEYFTDIEHYEKCAKLVIMLKRLENRNENISKNAITGSEIN